MSDKIKLIWFGGSLLLSFAILAAFCIPIAYRLGQVVMKGLEGNMDSDGCLGCLGRLEILFWNIVFILVFGGVVAFGIILIHMYPHFFSSATSIIIGVSGFVGLPFLLICYLYARWFQNPARLNGGVKIHGQWYTDWRDG